MQKFKLGDIVKFIGFYCRKQMYCEFCNKSSCSSIGTIYNDIMINNTVEVLFSCCDYKLQIIHLDEMIKFE